MDQELKRILDEQKEERKLLELRFLDAQQDLKRSEYMYINLAKSIFIPSSNQPLVGPMFPFVKVNSHKLCIEQVILA